MLIYIFSKMNVFSPMSTAKFLFQFVCDLITTKIYSRGTTLLTTRNKAINFRWIKLNICSTPLNEHLNNLFSLLFIASLFLSSYKAHKLRLIFQLLLQVVYLYCYLVFFSFTRGNINTPSSIWMTMNKYSLVWFAVRGWILLWVKYAFFYINWHWMLPIHREKVKRLFDHKN